MNPYPNATSVLSGRQKALYVALVKKNDSLAKFYLGALITFDQDANPDRFAQAAHSLRELMEKIPQYLDFPIESKPISLNQKTQQIGEFWNLCTKNSTGWIEGKWDGEIDSHLKRFLYRLQEFFDWFATVHPKIKERVSTLLRELDPSGESLPSKIESLRIEEWRECNGYFQGISHHTKEAKKEEFVSWLSVLEQFLLDRLAPRIFEDFDLIDSIISEGEGNGQP